MVDAVALRSLASSYARTGHPDLPLGMMPVACADVIALCDERDELAAIVRGFLTDYDSGYILTRSKGKRAPMIPDRACRGCFPRAKDTDPAFLCAIHRALVLFPDLAADLEIPLPGSTP